MNHQLLAHQSPPPPPPLSPAHAPIDGNNIESAMVPSLSPPEPHRPSGNENPTNNNDFLPIPQRCYWKMILLVNSAPSIPKPTLSKRPSMILWWEFQKRWIAMAAIPRTIHPEKRVWEAKKFNSHWLSQCNKNLPAKTKNCTKMGTILMEV